LLNPKGFAQYFIAISRGRSTGESSQYLEMSCVLNMPSWSFTLTSQQIPVLGSVNFTKVMVNLVGRSLWTWESEPIGTEAFGTFC
jgi:hypothetical protein